LISALNEIKNDERVLIEYLSDTFPELLKNMVDISTSAIMQGLGHKKFKHLFAPKKEKGKRQEGIIMRAPGGQMIRIKPNLGAHL